MLNYKMGIIKVSMSYLMRIIGENIFKHLNNKYLINDSIYMYLFAYKCM